MRVYFIGSHCTGKTTLTRYVSDKYKLPMITEVARAVLAEMEVPLERLRTDITVADDYQQRVFARQIESEERAGEHYVSDRAFDNIAYAAEHARVTGKIVASEAFKKYVEKVAQGIVFYVRPHRSIEGVDGVRELYDWDAIVRIDGMVKLLLEIHDVPYFTLHSPSMQERVRVVDYVLSGS